MRKDRVPHFVCRRLAAFVDAFAGATVSLLRGPVVIAQRASPCPLMWHARTRARHCRCGRVREPRPVAAGPAIGTDLPPSTGFDRSSVVPASKVVQPSQG